MVTKFLWRILMRYYEVILMIHPDQSDQVSCIIKNYTEIIKKSHGKIHRLEDWGRKQLAYSINKLQKAHYILINFETSQKTLNELKSNFKYNAMILRNMILRVKNPITELSSMMKLKEEKKENRESFINNEISKKI